MYSFLYSPVAAGLTDVRCHDFDRDVRIERGSLTLYPDRPHYVHKDCAQAFFYKDGCWRVLARRVCTCRKVALFLKKNLVDKGTVL